MSKNVFFYLILYSPPQLDIMNIFSFTNKQVILEIYFLLSNLTIM